MMKNRLSKNKSKQDKIKNEQKKKIQRKSSRNTYSHRDTDKYPIKTQKSETIIYTQRACKIKQKENEKKKKKKGP